MQDYDGAPVIDDPKCGVVRVRVRHKYKNAHFVLCYAHQLNLIVEQCITGNKEVGTAVELFNVPQKLCHD